MNADAGGLAGDKQARSRRRSHDGTRLMRESWSMRRVTADPTGSDVADQIRQRQAHRIGQHAIKDRMRVHFQRLSFPSHVPHMTEAVGVSLRAVQRVWEKSSVSSPILLKSWGVRQSRRGSQQSLNAGLDNMIQSNRGANAPGRARQHRKIRSPDRL